MHAELKENETTLQKKASGATQHSMFVSINPVSTQSVSTQSPSPFSGENQPEQIKIKSVHHALQANNQGQVAMQFKGVSESAETTKPNPAIQRKTNHTGLPDNLKNGIEHLSGYAMDDVKVHYNSNKPAQFNAHAFAQGTNIHLAPRQEKHLPHEAWHVVQQKQGRVKPTIQLKGKVNVNDNAGLEREANVMGARAISVTHSTTGRKSHRLVSSPTSLIQRKDVKVHPDEEYFESATPLKSLLSIPKGKVYYKSDVKGHLVVKDDNTGVKAHSKKISRCSPIQEITNPTTPDGNGKVMGDFIHVEYYPFLERDYLLVSKDNVAILSEKKDISILLNDKNGKSGKILPVGKEPPISEKDVLQTNIGDCYFQAALNSIVRNHPDDITNLFTNKDELRNPQNNKVIVTFPGVIEYGYAGDNQKPRKVEMDKELFLDRKNNPFFGGKKGAYLWPAFVQKAYAIIKGGYFNLNFGDPMPIVDMIRGKDNLDHDFHLFNPKTAFKSKDLLDIDSSWKLYDGIRAALDQGKEILLVTKDYKIKQLKFKYGIPISYKEDYDFDGHHYGLSIAHVYSILNMTNDNSTLSRKPPNVTLTLKNPKKNRLLKVPFKAIRDRNKISRIESGKVKDVKSKQEKG